MSTTAEFIDGAHFEEGIRSVRDDATADRYIVVGHKDGDPLRVEVVTVGQNTEDLGQLMDPSQVMYALARYETKFDMSNTIKFVYFRWVGEQVPVVRKGRYGVVHGSIEEKFRPYHTMVETSNVEDFDDAKIVQQLETTAGTKSMVLESTEGRQERGFTASQLPQRSQANKNTVSAVAKEGAHFEVLPMVHEDIAAVRDDNNPARWMLATYHNMDPRGPIVSVARGEGDLGELKQSLEADKAMYGLYRVTDKVDDIVTVKFVYITWVGNSVKPMTKAKLSTHKGTAESVFGPAHVKVFANDLSDITEKSVMDKVMSASGTASHVK